MRDDRARLRDILVATDRILAETTEGRDAFRHDAKFAGMGALPSAGPWRGVSRAERIVLRAVSGPGLDEYESAWMADRNQISRLPVACRSNWKPLVFNLRMISRPAWISDATRVLSRRIGYHHWGCICWVYCAAWRLKALHRRIKCGRTISVSRR